MQRRYQKQIEQLLAENPGFIRPESRRNEVLGWVKSGLQDFSLSRAKVEWGIKVPWDPSQTIYVWTEALMGYMTGCLLSQVIVFESCFSLSNKEPSAAEGCLYQRWFSSRCIFVANAHLIRLFASAARPCLQFR